MVSRVCANRTAWQAPGGGRGVSQRAGGKVEAIYFALGEHDAYVIVDFPDHVAVTAVSLAVNASGAVRVKTTVLMTPEEVDQAVRKTVKYRAPGK